MFKEKDLDKNELISIVKNKLKEARKAYVLAEKKLRDVVKYGSKQDIYLSAYNAAETQDKYANLYMLYYELTKEKQNG